MVRVSGDTVWDEISRPQEKPLVIPNTIDTGQGYIPVNTPGYLPPNIGYNPPQIDLSTEPVPVPSPTAPALTGTVNDVSDKYWWQKLNLEQGINIPTLPTVSYVPGYTTPSATDYIGSNYISDAAFEFLADPNNLITTAGPPVGSGIDTTTSTELFNTIYDSISRAFLDSIEPVTIDVARAYVLNERARGLGSFVTRIAEDIDYLSELSGISADHLQADPQLYSEAVNAVRRAAEESFALEDVETQANRIYTLVTTTASIIADEIARTGGSDIIKQVKIDSMSKDKRERYMDLENQKTEAEKWIEIYERNAAAGSAGEGFWVGAMPPADVDAENLAFYRQQYAHAAFEQERLLRETPINIDKAVTYVSAIKIQRELDRRAQEIVDYLLKNQDIYEMLKEADRKYKALTVKALEDTYFSNPGQSLSEFSLVEQANRLAANNVFDILDAINTRSELERPLNEIFANETYAEMARRAPFALLLNQFKHIPLGDLADAFGIPADYLEFIGGKYGIESTTNPLDKTQPWEFQEKLETWYAPFSTPLQKITDTVSKGLQGVGIPEPAADIGAQFAVMAPFIAAASIGGPAGWAILAGATASYAALHTVPMIEEYGLTSRQGAIAIADLVSNVAIFSPTLNAVEDAVVRSVIASVGNDGIRASLAAYGAAAATRAAINVTEDAAITGSILAIAGVPVGSDEWNRVMGYTLLQSASFGAAIPATGIFMRSGIAPLAAYALFYSAARYELGVDEEQARYIGLGAATAVAIGSNSAAISRALSDIDLQSRLSSAVSGAMPGGLKHAAAKLTDAIKAIDTSPLNVVFGIPSRTLKATANTLAIGPEIAIRKANDLADAVKSTFGKSVDEVTVTPEKPAVAHSTWRYDLARHSAQPTIEFFTKASDELFKEDTTVRTGQQIVDILDNSLTASGNPYALAAFMTSGLRDFLRANGNTVFTRESFAEAILLTNGIPVVDSTPRATSAMLGAGKQVSVRVPVFADVGTDLNVAEGVVYMLPSINRQMAIVTIDADIDYRMSHNGNAAVISTRGSTISPHIADRRLIAETIIKNAAVEAGATVKDSLVNSSIIIRLDDPLKAELLAAVRSAGVTPKQGVDGNYVVELADYKGRLTKDGVKILNMDSAMMAGDLPYAIDYSGFLMQYRGLPTELVHAEMRSLGAAAVGAVIDHFLGDDDNSDWDDLKRWAIYGLAFGSVGTVGKLLRYQSLSRLLSNQPDYRPGAVTPSEKALFTSYEALSLGDRLSGALAELLVGKHRRPHHLVTEAARTYRKFVVDRLPAIESYYQARAAAVFREHRYEIGPEGVLMRDGKAITMPEITDELRPILNEFFEHREGTPLTLSDAAAVLPVLQYHAKYNNNAAMADLIALVEDTYEIIRPIVNDLKKHELIAEDVTRRDIITLNRGLLAKSKLELSDGLYIPRGRTYELDANGNLIQSTDPYFVSNYSNMRKPEFGQRAAAQTQLEIQRDIAPLRQSFATPDIAIGSFAREAFHQLGSKLFSDFIIELNRQVPLFKTKDEILAELEKGVVSSAPNGTDPDGDPARNILAVYNELNRKRRNIINALGNLDETDRSLRAKGGFIDREMHFIRRRMDTINARLDIVEQLAPKEFNRLLRGVGNIIEQGDESIVVTFNTDRYAVEFDRNNGVLIVRDTNEPNTIVFDNRVFDENGNVTRVKPIGLAYAQWRLAEHKRLGKEMNSLLRRYDSLVVKDTRTEAQVADLRRQIEDHEHYIRKLDSEVNSGVVNRLAYADAELIRIKGAITALNSSFARFASQNMDLYNTTEIGGRLVSLTSDMRTMIKDISSDIREFANRFNAGEDIFDEMNKTLMPKIEALAQEWSEVGRPFMMVLSFLDPNGFNKAVIDELASDWKAELAAATTATALARGDTSAKKLNADLNRIERKIDRIDDPAERLAIKSQIASLRNRIADGKIRSIKLDDQNRLIVDEVTTEQVREQWTRAVAKAEASGDHALVQRVRDLEPLIDDGLVIGISILNDSSGKLHLHVDRVSENISLVNNVVALRTVMSSIEKFFSKREMDVVRGSLERYVSALRDYSMATTPQQRQKLLQVIGQSYEDFIASISGISPRTMVLVKDIAGIGRDLGAVSRQYRRDVQKYLNNVATSVRKDINNNIYDITDFIRKNYRRNTKAGMIASASSIAAAIKESAKDIDSYNAMLASTAKSEEIRSLESFLNSLTDEQRAKYGELVGRLSESTDRLKDLKQNGINSKVAKEHIAEEYNLTAQKVSELKKRLANIRKAHAKLPDGPAKRNILAVIDRYSELVDLNKIVDVRVDERGRLIVTLSPDFYTTVQGLTDSLNDASKGMLVRPIKVNDAELVDPVISILLNKNLSAVMDYAKRVHGIVPKVEGRAPIDTPELVHIARAMVMPLLISRPDIRVMYYYAFTSDFGSARIELEGFDKPPYTRAQIDNALRVVSETSVATARQAAAYIAEEALRLAEARMKFADVDGIATTIIDRLKDIPRTLETEGRTGDVFNDMRGSLAELSRSMAYVEAAFAGESVGALRKLVPAFEKLEAMNQKNIIKTNQLTIYRLAKEEIGQEWKRVYGDMKPSAAERKLMGQLIRAEYSLKELEWLQGRLDRLIELSEKNTKKQADLKARREELLTAKQFVENRIARYRDSRTRLINQLNNPSHPVLIGELGKLHFDQEIANAINKEVVRGNIGAFNDTFATINSLNILLKGFQASADVSFLAITGLLASYAYPDLSVAMIKSIIKQLKNPDMYFTYINQFNRKATMMNMPTVDQWITAYGLHFSHGDLPGQELSKIERPTSLIGKAAEKSTELPVSKQVIGFSAAAYSRMGNILRLEIANSLVPVYTYPGMSRGQYDAALRNIAKEVNLITGFSDRAFGDIGGPTGQIAQLTLFAARWFASQFQVIGDAVTKWKGPRGAIAREALFKMIAYGSILTFALNDTMDQETVVDPTDPNFMRVRIGDYDISLFGPWDSLLRGVVRATQGDPTYILESRLSPVANIMLDITREVTTGTTGDEKYGGPESVIDSWYWLQRVLPFSVSQLIEESQRMDDPDRDWKSNLLSGAVAFLSSITGLKATPLSSYERYREMMMADGVDPDDPLQVRLWKEKNIDRLYAIDAKTTVEYIERRNEYLRRKQEIDEMFMSGGMTIDEWYERIKVVNEEWANLARNEFGDGREPQSDKQKLIEAYRRINEETFKTGIADFDLRNKLLADFINTYGLEGLNYAETYMLVGKSEIEQQRSIGVYYLSRLMIDGQTVNYFDLPKMDPKKMVGKPDDMSATEYDDMIDKMRKWASNYRADRTYLKNVPVTATVRDNIDMLLDMYGGGSENWTQEEIQRLLIDVTNYGKNEYKNRLVDRIRKDYPYFTRLFDTNATWDIIQNRMTPREKAIIDSYLEQLGLTGNNE